MKKKFDITLDGSKVLLKEKLETTIAVTILDNREVKFFTGKQYPVYFYDKDIKSLS